jgi:hypothetical protein
LYRFESGEGDRFDDDDEVNEAADDVRFCDKYDGLSAESSTP